MSASITNLPFPRRLTSSSGSAAVVVMLTVGIGIAAGVATIGAGEFAKKQVALRRGAKGISNNQYFLNLLSERFRFTNVYQPVWFLEPYPTATELAQGGVPKVRVMDPSSAGTTMVPTFQGSSNYQVDKTGMGSIVFPPTGGQLVDSKGNAVTAQTAYLAAGDMSQLTSQWPSFFTTPTGSWPATNSGFTQTEVAAMTFNSVTPDPTYTSWAKELIVDITTGSGKSATRNTAKITLDPPQTPSCAIALSAGQALPLQPGSTAYFDLRANSIVANAELSSNDWQGKQELAEFANQSIKNVGQWKTFATYAYTVPNKPQPGFQANLLGVTGLAWAIRMNVKGVADPNWQYCELHVPVQIPPPPVCRMWANPPNPNYGAWTTVYMHCINEVTSAHINGVAVWLPPSTQTGFTNVQKVTWDTQWVAGSASGPGGSTLTWTTLGPNCRFNNPNYIENILMPWNEWRLYSHGPDRFYQSVVWGRSMDITYGVNWDIHGSPCGADELCMRSEGRWTNTDWFRGIAHLAFAPASSPSCALTRAYYRMPGQGCFVSGTSIELGDRTRVPINTLRVGDLVWNPRTNKAIAVQKITAGPEQAPLWKLTTNTGVLRITVDHPFLTERGLLPVQSLKKGDRLLGGKLKSIVKELSKEAGPTTEWVWNIELEGDRDEDHILNANGIPSGELTLQRKVKTQRIIGSSK